MRKLALSLILSAALTLLGFSAQLLCILHYRRKLRRAAPAGSPAPRKNLFLSALCIERNRSRVEPAAASPPATKPAEEEEEEECDLERWRAAFLGPSRVLYTIKEEEREELADSDLEKGFGFGSDKEEGPETPYYTPASSPARV